MMRMLIEPFKQCGQVTCSESYAMIFKSFPDHSEFKKTPFSKHVTSSILGGNMHVYYSETGVCVGVEVFPPLVPIWDGVELFSMNLRELMDVVINKGLKVKLSDSGLEIPDLGFSLFSYDFEDTLECAVDSLYVKFE